MKRLIAAASIFFAIATPTAAEEPRAQGLTGHYYAFGLGYVLDRYGVPLPGQQATEERVDAQIAFGPVGARRFVAESDGATGPILGAPVPWTPAGTGAVIWTGRIRFPQPGTYYLATVGGAPAAVYVNGARVALGTAPGAVSSAAIAYPDLAASTGVAPGYLVPITVDQPRELALELRFVANGAGGGVDLLWVTPDAPRGSGDKPMARLVPPEALAPTAPAVAAGDVSPPNSTITSDMLYLPVDGEATAKLSMRLADKAGRPIAGRRVHVVAMAGGGPRDEIQQPERPTDENGVAVATVRGSTAMGGRRTVSFFAVDVTDFVDVGQSAELVMDDPTTSFLPVTYAPYYDNEKFLVKPLPLSVGQPTRVTVPLMNRTRYPVELAARFGVLGYNIGASGWQEIGRVEHIALKPGESREVSVDWTPRRESVHVCLNVSLEGHYTASDDPDGIGPRSFGRLTAMLGASAHAAEGGISETRQRNIGPIGGCTPQAMALYTLLGGGIADFCFGAGAPSGPERLPRKPLPPLHLPKAKPGPAGPAPQPQPGDGGTQSAGTDGNQSPKDAGTNVATNAAYHYGQACDWYLVHEEDDYKAGKKDSAAGWLNQYNQCRQEQDAWNGLSRDPPDSAYQRLAVAATDTPVGYIDAARVSMERYRAAEESGDLQWMARHLTAMELYFRRVAEAERRAADAEEKQAGLMPADDSAALTRLQSDMNNLFTRLHRTGTTQDDLHEMQTHGVSEEQAKSFYDDLVSDSNPPQVKGPRATLLESAAFRRELADEAEAVAALSPTGAVEGTTFMQTYIVGNPHDRAEDVDLVIRRVSIPPAWQLKIIDAPAARGGAVQQLVEEVVPGEKYRVHLPARGEMRAASVVVPVGAVGENTTARWAVEGRIGDELIGGMMHEMNVPALIPDLQLPPIAPPRAPGPAVPVWAVALGAAAAVALAGAAIVLWRRRRAGAG